MADTYALTYNGVTGAKDDVYDCRGHFGSDA
jgi:hypothetical protein